MLRLRTLDLITTNAVARWFANEYVADEGGAIDHASIAAVLGFAAGGGHVVVRSRTLAIAEAWHTFAGDERSAPPAAIELPNVVETPLAILAPADVPVMLRVLLRV